jgi:hypothetical protein
MTRDIANERQRVSHASGAGIGGGPASERAGGSGPPSPRSGFGEVSPEPARPIVRAEADGAKPPGSRMRLILPELGHVVRELRR